MIKSSFGREADTRKLLIRNLVTSVILYESVVTTEAKARAVQPCVERIIRIGQSKDPLTARRQLQAYLLDENAVNKVLDELASRMSDRTSGFTRRFSLPPRKGDGSPQVIIQLTKSALIPDATGTDEAKTTRPAKKTPIEALAKG
jgi:large subunit ribosomal protein L17